MYGLKKAVFLVICRKTTAPEVFKIKVDELTMHGATVIEGVDYVGLEEKIKSAAEACPVQVIKYEEEE